MQKLLFWPSLENNETSGRSLTPSLGTPVKPDCHVGFGYPERQVVPERKAQLLGPPLPATMFSGAEVLVAVALAHVVRLFGVAELAHESFHVVSGMYPFAETCVPEPFAEFQNVVWMLA